MSDTFQHRMGHLQALIKKKKIKEDTNYTRIQSSMRIFSVNGIKVCTK